MCVQLFTNILWYDFALMVLFCIVNIQKSSDPVRVESRKHMQYPAIACFDEIKLYLSGIA